jgi:hypothetical protein
MGKSGIGKSIEKKLDPETRTPCPVDSYNPGGYRYVKYYCNPKVKAAGA